METRRKIAEQINLKSDNVKLQTFIVLLFVLWILRVIFIGKTHVESVDYAISFVLKFLVFVVYTLLFCGLIYKENVIKAFKLDRVYKGLVWGTIGGLCILLLGIGIMVVSNKIPQINISLKDMLHCFIFAAFFEELCFRGVILEKSSRLLSFTKANMITSLLFVLIHIPGYISQGTIASMTALSSMVIIFFTSMIWGYIFKKSDSLWSVILLHGTYDCVVRILGF